MTAVYRYPMIVRVQSRAMRAAVLFIATFACAGADLSVTIRKILNSTPEAKQCFWGIRVLDANSGRVLYSQNEDRFFVPASNTKLFTTSLALRQLGPNYKFRTRVEANAMPDGQGWVRELRLMGGGDPNLSSRLIPYNKEETGPDPLAAIRNLADQVVARGIRVVEEGITGDDSAYVWEPFPDGWGLDDPVYEYGAPVSALTLNDNAFRLSVTPAAEAGQPASLSLNPALEYLTVHNRTTTVESGPGRIRFDRIPGSGELVVSGTIVRHSPGSTSILAIDDPALFAAHAFREALEERGVRVSGGIRAVHRRAGEEAPLWSGTEIAFHESAPLSHIVQVINKVSQNLHTEMLLREIARVKTGVGSRRDGLLEIDAYLKEIGVEEEQWNFEDASGLSRLTLVTPKTVLKVLLTMWKIPVLRGVWVDSLPVGGLDGTLETRFQLPGRAIAAKAARIHAKTGSLSHVSALSGYAERRDGRTLAFSILVNNYNAGNSILRPVIDRVALALLD